VLLSGRIKYSNLEQLLKVLLSGTIEYSSNLEIIESVSVRCNGIILKFGTIFVGASVR